MRPVLAPQRPRQSDGLYLGTLGSRDTHAPRAPQQSVTMKLWRIRKKLPTHHRGPTASWGVLCAFP